jgi:LmbE family N-acetylglucosaminyl deacetylase
MKHWNLVKPGEVLRVLCLGAHSDDIEIGAGGTILSWIASGAKLQVDWCVASACGERSEEAQRSAEAFLEGAASVTTRLGDFKDSYFPYRGEQIKMWLEAIRSCCQPDVIFTHRRDDAHQDHRELSQLTWCVFRDHLILEYEIPKWDGDFGVPNFYMPIQVSVLERKIDLLFEHFATQRSKDWFSRETFKGLARLRGMECRATEGYAEAFQVRKVVLTPRS